ncbi:thioesterase [Rhizobium sp. AC44/96]|uniref:acyl-CoA thioesterase n=1 Tax=unclassified Rhizobium TaxID=2613769 RepID=UPI00080F9FC2|nr:MULTISPECIES: hotdog domain-containing protein [unclassified Rhizobium]MDM9623711.1 hotdog domain-containing protein [Rhizobium sp. S96]OCJ17884.1 thioesterase [Rhizobium sp. AC44/96]
MNSTTRSNTVHMHVPFRDVDMNGQMFLGSYISHAESVLAIFWLSRPKLADEPLYVASKVTCILHRPLHYDEKVVFTASVDKIGVRSAGFKIAADAGGERAAEVEIIWQAQAPEDRSPVPIPEETRDWLYSFID